MLPVRSAISKQDTGRLVVMWVTTGEYLLLYVFAFFRPVRGGRGSKSSWIAGWIDFNAPFLLMVLKVVECLGELRRRAHISDFKALTSSETTRHVSLCSAT
jgi:hypothetical protein